MYDKTIDDESRAFAEEIIADLKRDGWTFKKSDKDDPDYEAIGAKNVADYNKLLETGIVDMLLKM